MKRDNFIYWMATGFIILVEGVGTVATANAAYAKEIVYSLGYPEYFRVALLVFKLLGVLAIAIPAVSWRIKEWAYAGLFMNTLFAFISYSAIKGFGQDLVFPSLALFLIFVSYVYYHKRSKLKIVKLNGGNNH